jgi:hypothetical protein
MPLISGLVGNSTRRFVTQTGNQIPWPQGVGNFTGPTTYSLPQYPSYLGTISSTTAGIDSKFAIKITSNGMRNTSNSCAAPCEILVTVQDNTTGAISQHALMGTGGNQPLNSGCSSGWTGSPVTENFGTGADAYTKTTYVKTTSATSIEVTDNGKLFVNGNLILTNVKATGASIYAGYDGGTMTGTVEYLKKLP